MIIPANTIPCITVRQPWAWAMFALGDESKDIENRSRAIKYRGPMAIHVAQFKNWRAIEADLVAMSVLLGIADEVSPRKLATQMGCIIGIVDVVDCVRDSASRWAMPDHWHWVLANNRRVRPVPIKGQQGRFTCPVELEVL